MDLPKSGRNRLEEYLLYLCGKGAVYPLTPRNRLECFLDYLCKHAGGGGGGSVTVDAALSDTSKNPVQNQVIAREIAGINNITDYLSVLLSRGQNRVVMSLSGSTVSLDLERYGGIESFVSDYASGLNAMLLLPSAYLGGNPSNDFLVFSVDGMNPAAAEFRIKSVYNGKLYFVSLAPISMTAVSGQLEVYDLNLPNASGVSF